MALMTLAKPRYGKEQRVGFVGGAGTIKNYQPETGTWAYLIEMDMGSEPSMGRVGSETRILLLESDINHAVSE